MLLITVLQMIKPGYYTTGALSSFTIKDTTWTTMTQAIAQHKDSIEIFATTNCTTPLPFAFGVTPTGDIVDAGPNASSGSGNVPTPFAVPYWSATTSPPTLVGVVVRAIAHDQSVRLYLSHEYRLCLYGYKYFIHDKI